MDGAWAGYGWVGRENDDALMPGVHRAVRVADGLAVAIKLAASAEMPALRREAALAAVVDHPHLIQVIELAEDGPTVGLVTTWAQGGSLAELLDRRRTLDAREVVGILRSTAAALAAAHGRDVVHGDVTAANILFAAAGRAILADLGAARGRAESGVPVQLTPTDVAPEVARGKEPDAAADLFGLGSVGLACLTGRPAWPAESLRDVLVQSTVGQWPDPGEAGGDAVLTAAIRGLLDPVPDRRPGAAALVVQLAASGWVEVDLRLPGQRRGIVGAAAGRDAAVAGNPTPTAGGPAGLSSTSAVNRGRPNRVGGPGGRPRVATQLRDLGDAGPEPGRRRWRPTRVPAGTASPARRLAALRAVPEAMAREHPAPGPRHAAAPPGPGTPARRTRWRRVVVPVVAAVAVILGAVQAGLWWAGWEVPAAGGSAGSAVVPSGSAIAPVTGSEIAASARGAAGSPATSAGGSPPPRLLRRELLRRELLRRELRRRVSGPPARVGCPVRRTSGPGPARSPQPPAEDLLRHRRLAPGGPAQAGRTSCRDWTSTARGH